MKPLIYLTLIAALAQPSLHCAQAGCGQFFQGQGYQRVQAVIAPVYYFAGQATQDEAITRKAIRAELPAIVEAVRQSLTAPQQQATGIIAQKCARCHSGDNAKGGFRLDGELTSDTKTRALEVLAGIDVPQGMKAVVAGLKQEDFPALMQEILSAKVNPTEGVLR